MELVREVTVHSISLNLEDFTTTSGRKEKTIEENSKKR